MKKRASKKKTRKPAAKDGATRGYSEVISVGGQNDDWALTQLGEDADVWTNAWALTSRVRDQFRADPRYQGYRETLWANVLGSDGIMLRSTVMETEERVIHTPDEERTIKAHEERYNRVMEWAAKKEGREFARRCFLGSMGQNGTRKATVKVGDPDIFARLLIERAWREWARREFCDVRGVRNYQTIRQLRLISAVRDGDFFIRMVRDPLKNADGTFRLNKYGFALQLINSEWCDRFLNRELENGNVIRMGIEYAQNAWGIGKPLAYHFIKRQPRDWQWSTQGGFGYRGGQNHDRIPAEEIIHYARVVDADSTRPAPWVASTIPSARHLNQAMIYETIAWRAAASKTGWLESDVVPEGGFAGAPPDPTKAANIRVSPGGVVGLPWGVKHHETNPTHPNASVEEFRKAAMRDICAGMPGADYSRMANDYEAINFSAGRLQRLDTNETFMQLQTFDIDYAEVPIFEAWLWMALATQAIPLPLAKYPKFNNKTFQGRRWGQVDEVKENTADALAVANRFTSRTRVCAGRGRDFEEVLFEQAEEKMLGEQFGISMETTVETPGVASQTAPEPEDDDDAPPKKPAKKTRRATALTV